MSRLAVPLGLAAALAIGWLAWPRHLVRRPHAATAAAQPPGVPGGGQPPPAGAGTTAGVATAAAASDSPGLQIVRGQVRVDGRPQSGAEVLLFGGPSPRTLTSDSGGNFLFAAVPAGAYLVYAHTALAEGGQRLRLEERAPPPVTTLELAATSPVLGRVSGEGDAGIAAASVDFVAFDQPLPPRTITCDADGRFQLALLPGKYRVVASADDFAPAVASLVTVAAAMPPLALRLSRGATIDGRVVDDEGQLVAGAELQVTSAAADGMPIFASLAATHSLSALEPAGELGILRGQIPYPPASPLSTAATRRFRSDAIGHYRLTGLPGGRLVVVARHPDYLPAFSSPLAVKEGGAARLTLVMHRGLSLGGQVLDERERALGGAVVEVAPTGAPPEHGLSDAQGSFHVSRLPPGPYRVTVSHRDYAELTLESEARADLRLQLSPGGGLEGEVRDAELGVAPSGTKVEVQWGRSKRTAALVGSRFQLSGLPSHVTLTASAPGYVRIKRELTIPAGDGPQAITLHDVQLALVRAARLAGRVRDENGQPAPQVLVRVGEAATTTDDDGGFLLEELPAGKVLVSAVREGASTEETVELHADRQAHVELELKGR